MALGLTRKGWLYSIDYLNFQRNPHPLILPLYYRADVNCWACIDITYLSKTSRVQFLNKIQAAYASQIEHEQPIFLTYKMLKAFFPPAAKNCYRLYKPYYIRDFSVRKINPTVWDTYALGQPYINPNNKMVLNINHISNPGRREKTEGQRAFTKSTKPNLHKGFKQLKTAKLRKKVKLKTFSGKTL